MELNILDMILGVHLLKLTIKNNNINEEDAIQNLLEKALEEKNFCEKGYIIESKRISRHSDITIYGKCK